MRTRDEHLAWAKARALEYLDAGNLRDAVASMASDIKKHPDLNYPPALDTLGVLYLINHDERNIRAWIEGFN